MLGLPPALTGLDTLALIGLDRGALGGRMIIFPLAMRL